MLVLKKMISVLDGYLKKIIYGTEKIKYNVQTATGIGL